VTSYAPGLLSLAIELIEILQACQGYWTRDEQERQWKISEKVGVLLRSEQNRRKREVREARCHKTDWGVQSWKVGKG
jgi:hypothetical protein